MRKIRENDETDEPWLPCFWLLEVFEEHGGNKPKRDGNQVLKIESLSLIIQRKFHFFFIISLHPDDVLLSNFNYLTQQTQVIQIRKLEFESNDQFL